MVIFELALLVYRRVIGLLHGTLFSFFGTCGPTGRKTQGTQVDHLKKSTVGCDGWVFSAFSKNTMYFLLFLSFGAPNIFRLAAEIGRRFRSDADEVGTYVDFWSNQFRQVYHHALLSKSPDGHDGPGTATTGGRGLVYAPNSRGFLVVCWFWEVV